MFEELKPDVKIIQFKSPETGKWVNYALTYSRAIAGSLVKVYNDYYNIEWRIKPKKK